MESVTELRKRIAKEVTGDQSFDGEIASLDFQDRAEILNRIKAYIKENPENFTELQRTLAEKENPQKLDKYGVNEAIDSFSEGAKEGANNVTGFFKTNAKNIILIASVLGAIAAGLDIYAKTRKIRKNS